MRTSMEVLTPNEAAVVSGVSVRDVHRVIDEGILPDSFYTTAQERSFKSQACVFISFYFQTADRLTSEERQRIIVLAMSIVEWKSSQKIVQDDFLAIDLGPFWKSVNERLQCLHAARNLVVTDPEILRGTPIIRGTRIPVYDVAASVAAGIPMDRILSSYPSLNREQVELAALFADSKPLRGRPRQGIASPAGIAVMMKRRKLLPKSA